MQLKNLMDISRERCDALLDEVLKKISTPAAPLKQAMTYSVLNGGKRLRPLLVYATGHALDVPFENLDAPACAVELIHAYSLIHDDLPAMDNADLRRGKPSCHKAFSEATAILAGDALQAFAFEILTTASPYLSIEKRFEMIKILSHACGLNGMAAGQFLDMTGVDSIEDLTQMYRLKTGALLSAAIKMGMQASEKNNNAHAKALSTFADNIGLAFQIQDDILDIEGQPDVTGKPHGLDQRHQKITYPALVGLTKAKQTVETLFSSALTAVQMLGQKAKILDELGCFVLQRNF